MSVTGWSLNGTDLRRYGYNIRSTAGWDGYPGSRIVRSSRGFQHGDFLGTKGFYVPKRFSIALDVFPSNPDGTVTLQPEAHIQANLDSLMGLLHSYDRKVTIQKSFGVGPTIREAEVAVLDAFDVGSGFGPYGRTLVMRFEMLWPMWHQLPDVNLTSQTGSPNVTNSGNAPVGDYVMTFTAAGRVTWPNGEWLEVDSVAGGNVIVDAGAATVTQAGSPADARLTQGQPWFPDFEPGVNAMTVTATINLDYYHAFF